MVGRRKRTREDAFGDDLAAAVAVASRLAASPTTPPPPPPPRRGRSFRHVGSPSAAPAAPPPRRQLPPPVPRTLPPPPARRLPQPSAPARERPVAGIPPVRLAPAHTQLVPRPPPQRLMLPRPSVAGHRPDAAEAGATSRTRGDNAVGRSSALPGLAGHVGRSTGRLGFDVDPGPIAARRTVSSPAGVSVNRMPVFTHPAISIPEADQAHVHTVAILAAQLFNKEVSFCKQTRGAINDAVAYLELWEPHLAVCVRSWGACSLLSSITNDDAEYRARARKRAAARAAARSNTAPASVPAPRSPPPTAAPELGLAAPRGTAASPAGATREYADADEFCAAT